MGSEPDSATFTLDFQDADPIAQCYSRALQRLANKKCWSTRRKLEGNLFPTLEENTEPLSIRTIDNYIQGRAVPAWHNCRKLVWLLGIDFSAELVDVLIENKRRDVLTRAVNSYILNIPAQEDPRRGYTTDSAANRTGRRCPNTACGFDPSLEAI